MMLMRTDLMSCMVTGRPLAATAMIMTITMVIMPLPIIMMTRASLTWRLRAWMAMRMHPSSAATVLASVLIARMRHMDTRILLEAALAAQQLQ